MPRGGVTVFDYEFKIDYKPALDNADWTLRDMILGGLTALGLILAGSLIVIFFVAVVFPDHYDVLYFPAMVVAGSFEGLLVFPAWWWGPHKYGGDWRRLGLLRCDLWRGVLVAVGGAAAMWGVNALAGHLAADASRVGHLHGGLFLGSPWRVLGSVLLFVILAPLAEEILFRGFLYAGLRNRFGVRWAVAISAALFALAYLSSAAFVPTLLIGAILAGVYELSGSLWPGIAARAVLSAVAIVMAG